MTEMTQTPRVSIFRLLGACAAGGIAWSVAFFGLFDPAQSILGDPRLQSAKMTAIFEMNPPPRIATDPWLLPVAFLVVGSIHALVFACIRRGLPEGRIAAGAAFGIVAWALFTPWFEFYIPWNLMIEPTALVLLEMGIWLGIMLAVGLAISLAYGPAPRPQAAGNSPTSW